MEDVDCITKCRKRDRVSAVRDRSTHCFTRVDSQPVLLTTRVVVRQAHDVKNGEDGAI